MFGVMEMKVQPLAFRMRPRSIDEVVGQQHLVGEGKSLPGWSKQNSCHP